MLDYYVKLKLMMMMTVITMCMNEFIPLHQCDYPM